VGGARSSDKLIAYELGMRAGTVSGLMARVFQKLGVRSRTAMAERLTAPLHASAVTLPDGDELVVFSDDRDADEAWLAPLTSAERDAARAIARGLRNEEIAVERGVSARAVESQLSTIYKKLGVRSRAELSARRR
jgi:DNA-binding NarL/FixJ family response regulator